MKIKDLFTFFSSKQPKIWPFLSLEQCNLILLEMNLIDGKVLTEEIAIKQFFSCIHESANSQPLLSRFSFCEFLIRIGSARQGKEHEKPESSKVDRYESFRELMNQSLTHYYSKYVEKHFDEFRRIYLQETTIDQLF